MNLKEGDTIYKYELERLLGSGCFGSVWLAKDKSIDKKVALKILPSNFGDIAKKLEEARIGNKVSHKNLLQIFYADIVDDGNGQAVTLIAQEYQEKGSL